MNRKAVAIVGSYRKGGITEQTVDAMLGVLEKGGVETRKILLIDKHVEFCRNCRTCTQTAADQRRGTCVIQDDMEEILSAIDAADSVILAAPVNFSSSTAIMKRFIERLIAYTYWPWGQMIPSSRVKRSGKKAVLVTSSGAPSIINRIVMPAPLKTLRRAADVMGVRVKKTLYMGSAGRFQGQTLSPCQLRQAESAARSLLD